jgi:hypothetical protein
MSQKIRVFGLKTLFLKRFTVRSTTRTLIIDKTDHSAFTAIIRKGAGNVPKNIVECPWGVPQKLKKITPVLVLQVAKKNARAWRSPDLTGTSSTSTCTLYHLYLSREVLLVLNLLLNLVPVPVIDSLRPLRLYSYGDFQKRNFELR